jgi:hypothetical protein
MSDHQRSPSPTRSLARLLMALVAVATAACSGTTAYEVPVETPIRAKLDVSSFQRVLFAGFVAGGNDEVDGNQETVRLLRSHLRTKSQLRVIDADPLPLSQIAQSQNASAEPEPAQPAGGDAGGVSAPPADREAATTLPASIKSEKDIELYERVFANTAYWKQIGEEYQNPLIVTGSVLFMERTASNMVSRQTERLDAFGRRQVENQRGLLERRGYVLRPKFYFIDGRTGAVMHVETHKEEVLYSADQNIPALSSYFELMDRLVPSFLGALSSQKVRGLRVLLK